MPMHDWAKVDAGVYHAMHTVWIVSFMQGLNRILPSEYYAAPEQRIGDFLPDVIALERAEKPGGGVAIAPKPLPQAQFVIEAPEEIYAQKQNRIAIRSSTGDLLVAVIEILSPGNKASKQAFRQLLEKIEVLLEHRIHLLIIDPFPPSSRDPQGIHAAIWQDRTPSDYRFNPKKPLTIVAYQCAEITRAFVEPLAVGDALRDMPVYLEPNFYVDAPLEDIYNAAYGMLPEPYRREVEAASAK